MLRSSLLKAGRIAAALGRQPLNHPSGSVLVGSQCAWRDFSTNSHDIFNTHKHNADNNWETPFDFTDENYEIAAEILTNFPTNYKASAVIPLLDLAQKQNQGWLSLNAMNKVAEVLNLPPIRVYEVATFYTMFNRSKMGKYHVMVCGTTPCMLQGARKIYQTLKEHLGVDYGQTTEDGMYTLSEMECMGSCVNAPMIAVADYSGPSAKSFTYNYYEDLTPEDAVSIVDDLKAGKKPRVGSQHRDKAEPAGAIVDGKWVAQKEGQTTLTWDQPPGPYCRDLTDPPKEAAPEAKK
ncbi:hypothetical protein ABBQ38_015348 [Trebouxia sp. C0009 RCD-2024]